MRHRHGGLVHDHAYRGPHRHLPLRWRSSEPVPEAEPGHGHSHGFVDRSIVRSREGLRAVGLSLAILGVAAIAQLIIFIATNSIALLADLIHNFGDAATAIPLGAAFALRSERAERWAGLAVVLAIFVSACVVGVEAVNRLLHPSGRTRCSSWPARALSDSSATGSLRECGYAPGLGSTVRHSWPTAVMPRPKALIARDRIIRRRTAGSVSVARCLVQCRIIPV